jgi:glycosyltransferase involved in cell wall biosynthesis
MMFDVKIEKIFFQFLECILGRIGASTLLACSTFEESSGKELGINRIRRLGNFIEVPKAKFLQEPLLSTKTDLVVGTVGRICEQKNPEMYRRVVQKLHPKISCRWIGAGDNKDTCHLENAGVRVSGWLNKEDVYSELSQLRVFIMTSKWEGLPITAIEALAIGVPIVSIGFNGCDEVVLHGETGLICENESEMVDAINKILHDKKLHDSMSENSVRHFRENFDYRLLLDSWELAYSLQ